MKNELSEILVKSSVDGTMQPSLFWCPETGKPVPLVVGLHPWSHTRFYPIALDRYFPLAQEYGFALLLPDFRGPNLPTNPNAVAGLACGSTTARADIFDAIEDVASRFPVDRANIFLLGTSGGGHMSLLCAETRPELFRAVDVWCPVTDIARWYDHVSACKYKYKGDIEACLGGTPAEKPEETDFRSPSANPAPLAGTTVSIHHGRRDPIVPYVHSLDLARKLAEIMPDRFFFEIFDGVHESFNRHSFEWFARLAGTEDAADRIGQ